jgi:primosomal protein N' (replication factor Y)
MFYYHVWVRSGRYHGNEPLTYTASRRLKQGTIVEVELQHQTVLGFVSGPTAKPRFQTKEIRRIFDFPALPSELIRLASWIKSYYPASIGSIAQQFLPIKLSENLLTTAYLTSLPAPFTEQLPPLTNQQAVAFKRMHEHNTYLLHGVTGSGKTRLYIECALKTIESGKSVIVLTPEISLVTQLANSFQEVFSQRVIIQHSQQTPKERRHAWLTCLTATQPLVVIGPRSTLFSPLNRRPGLIVLDEAHETAYKQEQSPQYQTSRVAAYLAGLTRASLIFGSATPSVSDYYLAEQKRKPIISLTDVPLKPAPPRIEVVDRKDHTLFNRSPYLSQILINAISIALAHHKQTLLYLNRRGTARLVLCENCGWQALCPHCDVLLTYHGDQHQLRCHSCSYHQHTPVSCPVCSHANILFKSAGTKAIVEEVKRLFPAARIGRFDTDNVKAERFEKHYNDIKSGSLDIIVGTQLLAKGLDLPKLSTLGVLLADTSLYLPDFSSQERTFQLLTQVIGRIGRGHVAGHAIIQTYHPDHPVIANAIANDYKAFYEHELAERHQFKFPPFCYLLKITFRRASLKSVQLAASKLKDTIQGSGVHVLVEGPAPSFYEHLGGKYQWQLVIKATRRQELIKIIKQLPAGCSYDIDPSDLL